MLPFRLHHLNRLARAGISFLLLVVLLGFVTAANHLVAHHENRDERPEMSLDDLVGAYTGIRTTAPLIVALEAGHPEELPEKDRSLLLGWLGGDRLSEDYDSLSLGDDAPAEVIDRACLSCHSAGATEGDGIGDTMPLEYWDQVKNLAYSRDVSPTALEILVASAHTHALGMGTLSLLLVLMALASRWPCKVVGGIVLLNGLGLSLDLGCWFLARSCAAFVPVLAAAGAAWAGTSLLLVALILGELWLPSKEDK